MILAMKASWQPRDDMSKKEINCKLCNDKGFTITHSETGYELYNKCECAIKKENQERIERSGLSDFFKTRSFDNFNASTKEQKEALSICKTYVGTKGNNNLLLLGAIGSGKTHLAAACLMELGKKGAFIRYVNYLDMVKAIGIAARDTESYFDVMRRYKEPRVLLIDDLYKGVIRETHLSYIYEIINDRYNTNKKTIITSEKHISALMEIDPAISSRLLERAKDFTVTMQTTDNYRVNKFLGR